MPPPNKSTLEPNQPTIDPTAPFGRDAPSVEHLLQWLVGTAAHLAIGLLLGMLAARAMRRLHLHWSWAAAALALVLLAHAALAGEAFTLGIATLAAAFRGRRWHDEDLQAGADLATIAAERTTPLDGARDGMRTARRLAARATAVTAAWLSARALPGPAGRSAASWLDALRRATVADSPGGAAWCGGRLRVGSDRRHRPVSIELGDDGGGAHTLVAGATGAGKTFTQAWIATQAIAQGMSVIAVDPKGDAGLHRRLHDAAQARGVAFHLWTPDGPSVYNPFARGTAGEIADRALAGERFTEPHYQRQAQRYLGHAVRALLATRGEVTLAGLVDALDPDGLELLARRLDDGSAHTVHAYLDSLAPRQRADLGGVRDRLAILAESDVGRWLDPITFAPSFELLDAVRTGAVVYFVLDADARPLLAQMLGRAIVQDLQSVVAALQGRPGRCLVAIDEFSAVAAEQVAALFARARSAGVSLLLGTQELSDLRLPGRETLLEQVLGNLTTLIAHRQTVPASAELIARLAGSRGVWRASVGSDGRTTRTRISAPLIGHEEVMGLPRGCAAVLRLASPRAAAIARMRSPG
ncbi:MAG TPA: helicase HerA-like domain-containing protein [Solirubrobacteraceae bacterium]|jgi:hypothetical protein|nr:helicase HerA-like domain-containing protein [Solirubrobacteraceae bacterium]